MIQFFERGEIERFSVEIFDASKPEEEWPAGVERLKDWRGEPVYAHSWKGVVRQIKDGDGIEFCERNNVSFHVIHAREIMKGYRKKPSAQP